MLFILLLLLYFSVLFYITLFAWNYGSSYGALGPGGRNYNLIPFRSIYRIAYYSPTIDNPLRILGGNIMMFIPFGVLTALISYRKRRAFWLIPLLSVLLSMFIEVNQFIFTHRVANIDDVILNTAGGIIGAWFTLFFCWLYQWLKQHKTF
ncbi:VanZ family protein [Alteribacillus persepolensis]